MEHGGGESVRSSKDAPAAAGAAAYPLHCLAWEAAHHRCRLAGQRDGFGSHHPNPRDAHVPKHRGDAEQNRARKRHHEADDAARAQVLVVPPAPVAVDVRRTAQDDRPAVHEHHLGRSCGGGGELEPEHGGTRGVIVACLEHRGTQSLGLEVFERRARLCVRSGSFHNRVVDNLHLQARPWAGVRRVERQRNLNGRDVEQGCNAGCERCVQRRGDHGIIGGWRRRLSEPAICHLLLQLEQELG
mmetsp:Transcript_17315/g.56677  ORF Transcript_17315/g.56677 Transcript_17315/m.56677 type:complete len:243 (-) Transcript_17315:80-808(-)